MPRTTPRVKNLALTLVAAGSLAIAAGCGPIDLITGPRPDRAPEPVAQSQAPAALGDSSVVEPSPSASSIEASPVAVASASSAAPSEAPTPVASASVEASQASTATASAAPSVSASATSSVPVVSSASARPTSPVSATAKPSATASATTRPAAPVADGAAGDVRLDLPRIPWEGGPDYWSRFPAAQRAGWTDPNFFPIAVWWGGIGTDAEAEFDKAHGFNTYVQMDKSADEKLFARHGMHYIGNKPNDGWTSESKNWPGTFLDDEVEGRFSNEEGVALLRRLQAENQGSGRFGYSNFSSMLVNQWFPEKVATDYINTSDLVSLDAYTYTTDYCNWDNYLPSYYIGKPIKKESCRTASTYGKLIDSLRIADAKDGKLTPMWNFVEMNNPVLPDRPHHFGPIKPEQLKGAAMSTLIHEGRGLIYYNQDYTTCPEGNLLRSTQRGNGCAAAQVKAAGEVNRLVQSLAPVLNTQSYQWSFGNDIDSMLKVHDGHAYVFAMVKDGLNPGQRTFTVPAELKGRPITVVGENRTITPNADGTFSDDFAAEYSYHVYKIG